MRLKEDRVKNRIDPGVVQRRFEGVAAEAIGDARLEVGGKL
jgi:hypothetical protein